MADVGTVEGKEIGRVTEYFARIGVAGIDLTGPLRAGDRIHIQGHTTDFKQVVESVQIEHASVDAAKKNDKIGLKVAERCRRGDHVYVLAGS